MEKDNEQKKVRHSKTKKRHIRIKKPLWKNFKNESAGKNGNSKLILNKSIAWNIQSEMESIKSNRQRSIIVGGN